MQFSEASELNVLAYASHEVIHKSWLARSNGAMVCQPVRLLTDVINESLDVDGGNLGVDAVNEVRKKDA